MSLVETKKSLFVDDYTYGHEHIIIHFLSDIYKVVVGKFCSIGENCNIYLEASHRSEWITTFPFGRTSQMVFNNKFAPNGPPGLMKCKGDVIIGNDVWIAKNVTIMSGVKIGDGAVIANNSHVVKDIPPYSIVGGNPAQVIKYRFPEEKIEKLLEIQWWNWDTKKIEDNIEILCSPRLDSFLYRCKYEKFSDDSDEIYPDY